MQHERCDTATPLRSLALPRFPLLDRLNMQSRLALQRIIESIREEQVCH
jgi:hypothetical protein